MLGLKSPLLIWNKFKGRWELYFALINNGLWNWYCNLNLQNVKVPFAQKVQEKPDFIHFTSAVIIT